MIEITDSSRVVGVDWHEGVMTVQFKDGSLYDYRDVSNAKYREFLESPSKGQFIHQNMGHHEYSRR